jgi:hypothetical protein
MIKVAGILMTIFGAIEAMGLPSRIEPAERGFGGSDVSAISAYAGSGFSFLFLIEVVTALATLAFGIAGIVLSKDGSKASAVILFGVVLLALEILVFSVSFGSLNAYPVLDTGRYFDLIFSSVLPVLYIVGGSVRRKGEKK